jgi:hypothetical protein
MLCLPLLHGQGLSESSIGRLTRFAPEGFGVACQKRDREWRLKIEAATPRTVRLAGRRNLDQSLHRLRRGLPGQRLNLDDLRAGRLSPDGSLKLSKFESYDAFCQR